MRGREILIHPCRAIDRVDNQDTDGRVKVGGQFPPTFLFPRRKSRSGLKVSLSSALRIHKDK